MSVSAVKKRKKLTNKTTRRGRVMVPNIMSLHRYRLLIDDANTFVKQNIPPLQDETLVVLQHVW